MYIKWIAVVLLLIPRLVLAWSCKETIPDSEGQQLMLRAAKAYSSVTSISSAFVQESSLAGMSPSEPSRGQVVFEKPGRMHWSYKSPEPQEFVSDGETLWFFQPDLKQVVLSSFRDSFDSELPVSFLMGVGALDESFDLLSACRLSGEILFELKPKSAQGDLERFWLRIDEDKLLPTGAKTIDVGGNETTFRLLDRKINLRIEESSFKFEIPGDVDVIDRRNFSGEVKASKRNW